MKEALVFAVMATPMIALAVVLYLYDRIRRREELYRWACSQNLNLISAQQPLLTEASAFPVSLSKSQFVFRVHVETKDGNRRSGWVRFGATRPGHNLPDADVKWDQMSIV